MPLQALITQIKNNPEFVIDGKFDPEAVRLAIIHRGDQMVKDHDRGYGSGDKHPIRGIELIAKYLAKAIIRQNAKDIAEACGLDLDELINQQTSAQNLHTQR